MYLLNLYTVLIEFNNFDNQRKVYRLFFVHTRTAVYESECV